MKKMIVSITVMGKVCMDGQAYSTAIENVLCCNANVLLRSEVNVV